MARISPILFPAILAVVWPSVAPAHTGHVAELAGHSHWLGLAAVAAAAAIAAALAKAGGKRKAEAEAEPDEQPATGNSAA